MVPLYANGPHAFAASDSWHDQFKTNDAEHNIVADELAEASNPQPHHTPPPTHTYPQKNICTLRNARFSCYQLERDGLMDQQTNGRTDKAYYKIVSAMKKGKILISRHACLIKNL